MLLTNKFTNREFLTTQTLAGGLISHHTRVGGHLINNDTLIDPFELVIRKLVISALKSYQFNSTSYLMP